MKGSFDRNSTIQNSFVGEADNSIEQMLNGAGSNEVIESTNEVDEHNNMDSISNEDVEQELELNGEDEYFDKGEFNKDFLRLMHFRAQLKNTKMSKITQAETIAILMKNLDKEAAEHEKAQAHKHADGNEHMQSKLTHAEICKSVSGYA